MWEIIAHYARDLWTDKCFLWISYLLYISGIFTSFLTRTWGSVENLWCHWNITKKLELSVYIKSSKGYKKNCDWLLVNDPPWSRFNAWCYLCFEMHTANDASNSLIFPVVRWRAWWVQWEWDKDEICMQDGYRQGTSNISIQHGIRNFLCKCLYYTIVQQMASCKNQHPFYRLITTIEGEYCHLTAVHKPL